MTISNKTVFKDYLAVKHSGQTDVRLSKGSRIDVLIKNEGSPDRLIKVENKEVSGRYTGGIRFQMVEGFYDYQTQYPDRQATTELWWILPRNSIANGAARKRLIECTSTPYWKEEPFSVIKTIDDRPVNLSYKIGNLEFSSEKEIKNHCHKIQEIWEEYGLIRDEDRAVLLALAKATWPLARAVEFDQGDRHYSQRGVWFILNGQVNPVTKTWGPLVRRWISKVHHRWWTTPVIDNLTPVPAVV